MPHLGHVLAPSQGLCLRRRDLADALLRQAASAKSWASGWS